MNIRYIILLITSLIAFATCTSSNNKDLESCKDFLNKDSVDIAEAYFDLVNIKSLNSRSRAFYFLIEAQLAYKKLKFRK